MKNELKNEKKVLKEIRGKKSKPLFQNRLQFDFWSLNFLNFVLLLPNLFQEKKKIGVF